MFFPRLDGSGTAIPVYSIGWRIVDHPDAWTKRFQEFKQGNVDAINGAKLLLPRAVFELVKAKSLNAKKTGLVTALSSSRTLSDINSPLFKAGEYVCSRLGFQWLPDLYNKKTHRSLHSIPSADKRDKEVANKYSCGTIPDVDTIIILDDFVTRGSTMAEMARALHAQKPNVKILGFALGKNERYSYAIQSGVLVTNLHIPRDWTELWDKGKLL